jgi:hypothetical protein
MPIIDPQTGQDVSDSRTNAPDARPVFAKLKPLFWLAWLFQDPGQATVYVSPSRMQGGIAELSAPWTPHPVQFLRGFTAPEPWTAEAAVQWSVSWYSFEPNPQFRATQQATIRARFVKSDPAETAKLKPRGVETGIETNGRCHLLPRMLARRWRRGECEDRALPLLLHRLERSLRRTDFTIQQKLLVLGFCYIFGVVGWPAAGGAAYFYLTDTSDGGQGLGLLAAAFLTPFFTALAAHLAQIRRDRRVDRLIGELLAGAN